ncbi:hypothetical protein B0A58_10575 [Flavobacterium branchiophilum NBRC 15030 = ATCC 35035]|uniref:Uncharacterized protein n=1 Tax=Flavobacterium branchiophilum TaxID=55197 RepID=A0A543G8B9_9FLAO|nr:hypothetical protein [Flavobacterium branchiophilum]OXA74579.1 hypothetical protein B0A58_10575 [Flavobacterium branchiophilum NBRC 15030 = ATCC 35035]TQM42323.1 hypothetical protein BC670_3374 [Flavobacterium branchiophilum]GEM55510.1 hypothetical protein FB1_17310 [Flavobacterium branchiophilum NBRC 15030 = ATCC 35035]
MSNFFLLNEAIELERFDLFLDGMYSLNSIEKKEFHHFRKHSSVYELKNYAKLFESYGQIEQLAVIFIEQLSTSEKYINCEESAKEFCGNEVNGFLGIDFSTNEIVTIKQISNNDDYKNWIYHYLSIIDKLKEIVPNYKFYSSFEKEFKDLSVDVQKSIIDYFIKAKERNLVSPFSPDTKIIKDVTQPNFQYKIMELRVYTPVALRVYFNELNGFVNLISIEQKSNADQNEDIKKAHSKYKNM